MSTGSDEQRELAAMLADVFAAGVREDALELDRELWGTLAEVGMARLTAGEAAGGSEASWAEAALLLNAAGYHAASLPLAENDLMALPVLEAAGIPAADDAVRTVAVLGADGVARDVPWARNADKIVVVWQSGEGWLAADVERSAVAITEGANYPGEPRDQVSVDVAPLQGKAVSADLVQSLRYRGALARAAEICGALERILELVVEHTTSRTQFGRPIAKFQAVQFLAADIATEYSLARAATDAAVAAVARDGFDSPDARFAIAAAKSCAGHAAAKAVRKAHQAFGAIGYTKEHSLHRFANRALAWSGEYGSRREWDDELTAAAVAAGSKGLWSLLVTT
jgi:acyl-CoA dehydrogenase